MIKLYLKCLFWLAVIVLAWLYISSCSSVKPVVRSWCNDTKQGAIVTTIKGMRNTDREDVLHPGCDCKQLTFKK